MESLVYASIVVSAIATYLIARYGQEHYNKTLAGSFFIGTSITLILIDLTPPSMGLLTSYYTWIIILVITVLLFLFSRICTYVVAAGAFMGMVIAALVALVGMEPDQTVGMIALVAGIVVTILLRKHLIKVLVGLFSGYYAGLTLTQIVSVASPLEGVRQIVTCWSPLQIVILVLLAFAVYFQYCLHEKVFGAKTAASPTSGGGE